MKNLIILIAILATSWQFLKSDDPDVLWTVDNTKPFLPTYECRFTPDNKYVIAATGNTISKYDAMTGQLVSRFKDTCEDFITKMSISPAYTKIIACDFPQHKLYIWDYQHEKLMKIINFVSDTTDGLSGISISADDKYAIVGIITHNRDDQFVLLLNLDSYMEEKRFYVPRDIWELAFSPDGKYFITASSFHDSQLGSVYTHLYLWKTDNWEFVQELGYLKGKVLGLFYSPNGNMLACANDANVLSVWDMINRKKIKELKAMEDTDLYYERAAFSHNSRYILYSPQGFNRKTFIYDLKNDSLVYTYNYTSVSGLELSTDDNFILTSAGSFIRMLKQKLNNADNGNEEKNTTLFFNINYKINNIFLNFNIKVQGIVLTEIFGINGAKIESIDLGYLQEGAYTIEKPLILPSGVYFAKLSCGNYSISQKFVVSR